MSFRTFKISTIKFISASILVTGFSFVLTSFVFAQDYGSGEEFIESVKANAPKAKDSEVTDFFHSKKNQNFFDNRNLSTNSIFSKRDSDLSGLGEQREVSSEVDSISQDSWDTRSEGKVVKQEIVETKPEPVLEQKEEAVQDSSYESSLANSSSKEVDPNIQDALEQSKKIREAIFGAEAASKLPVSLREKLKDKVSEGNVVRESTRF